MDYSDIQKSEKEDYRLKMALSRYKKSRLIDEEEIFRMTSVEKIIDALIENLKTEYVDVLTPVTY
ncbi:MAG: hypothetical protein K6E78_04745, partial [Treponema sp.]|nr:hypothetical protein [Treponema sp.]